MMTNQEDKEFLLAQREPGRRGRMGGVDSSLLLRRRGNLFAWKRPLLSPPANKKRLPLPHLWRSSSPRRRPAPTLQLLSQMKNTEQLEERVLRRGRNGPRRTSSLQHWRPRWIETKLTDRSATYVLTEAARCLGQNVEELNINRSSIRRQRLKHRAAMASKIREEFRSGTPLVVHWDGKLVMDLTTKEHVDRLPIIISGIGGAQLLAVAKFGQWHGREHGGSGGLGPGDMGSRGSGSRDVLRHHGIQHRPAETGPVSSSNRKWGKTCCISPVVTISWSWWYMRCSSVFLGCSSSPEHLLFKRFQTSWESIDREDFGTGIMVEEVATVLEDVKDEALRWTLQVLQEREDLRDDYRELVKLVIIFLGGAPPGGIRFLAPGAMHQARWMSKVLYSFKIWMFRGQFRLTKKEERGLQRLCLFVVRVYAKAWIEASFSVQAPRLDLELIKALGTYDKIDPEIGDVALSKLSSHLWYVSEELVGLSFFDSDVSCETKNAMVTAYDERNLTERTRLRKESRFQRSRSEISTWKTSSVDVLSTSSGSYTWMRPSSICHRTRGRWTRGSSGPLRSSGTSLW
ncbi:hypothetical protein GWK47_015469 [Chionoecetes opilio]|uniref:Uncharacterized protein n=1 Tax=Chionoecetes opilio TaxID=41210 RepID=A0A8J5CIB7_CHIOP|nr:hypothetical protein GWK47_015469 [Chionoecetes opilio]